MSKFNLRWGVLIYKLPKTPEMAYGEKEILHPKRRHLVRSKWLLTTYLIGTLTVSGESLGISLLR